MAHVAYPSSFPAECVADLISIGRGGLDEIRNRRAEVGLHAWNVLGFAQAMALGNPDNVGDCPCDETEDQALADQVNELCILYAAAAGVAYQPATFGARVNWAQLIAFLKEILPIILPLILDQ